MAKHQNLSSPFSVHPFAFSSNADPSNDGSIDMAPYKGWINTGSSNTLKVRNAANTAWEDVSVAGAANTPAFGSNSNNVASAGAGGASTLASRADHVHLGVTSIAHTSNTFSGPITLVAGANIGITSSTAGTYRIDGSAAAGGGGGGSVTAATTFLTAPVTQTNADTYYDGPSASFAAGTWLFSGNIEVKVTGVTGWQTAKLWDGTTSYAASECFIGDAGEAHSLSFTNVSVVLGSTTTIKISAACTAGSSAGSILDTPGNNATGLTDKASWITGIKIA